jgi:uncharacterized protein (DUF4415 family)
MSASAHQHVGDTMRKHYEVSIGKRNPYARRLKQQVTIRLDPDTLAYFKMLAGELGIPNQTLIDLYLRDCASSRKRLAVTWRPSSGQGAA